MRLLVTGAAGFIGSNFVRHWVTRHPTDYLVALDALTYAGNLDNLSDLGDRVCFVHQDVCDLAGVEATLAAHDIDTVVHFAAESHNSLAVLDPGRFFRTNVLGTQALLEGSRRVGVGRFHHISTCEVYGDLPMDSDESFDEQSPYRPRTPYNASKAGADHAVRAYGETYGLPATITNCSNNYGPYQFPEKVIPLFVTRALADQPLPLYASTHHRREWLHVLDHCRAVETVLERRADRRDVSRRQRGGGERGDRRQDSRHPGQAPLAQDHRPGPTGSRPPLPARLFQDQPRAGLAAGDPLCRGAGGDGPLVRGAAQLVGATDGSRAGGRECLGRCPLTGRPGATRERWG